MPQVIEVEHQRSSSIYSDPEIIPTTNKKDKMVAIENEPTKK